MIVCLIYAKHVLLKTLPKTLVKESSENSTETVGLSFAADVLKCNRQLVLLLRETVTSFATYCIFENEKYDASAMH